MTQSRRASFLEVCAATGIRFCIATAANYLILPAWGCEPSPGDSLQIALAFTLLSLATSYPIRRFFNWLSYRKYPYQ